MNLPRRIWKSFGRSDLQPIRSLAAKMEASSDSQLRRNVTELRQKIQLSKTPLQFVDESFAVLSVATQRIKGMTPYDVQLTAAKALTQRRIVEMATGEGKTLTALFPLFFRALQGRGVLLATANDYLASRDVELARGVFESLGVSVGVVVDATAPNAVLTQPIRSTIPLNPSNAHNCSPSLWMKWTVY